MVPSLLREVLNFFTTSPSPVFLNCLSSLYLNHDTIIPDYVNDRRLLVHLAFILFPQIGGHSLEKIALQYLDEENEDVDVEILDAPLLSFRLQARRRRQ